MPRVLALGIGDVVHFPAISFFYPLWQKRQVLYCRRRCDTHKVEADFKSALLDVGCRKHDEHDHLLEVWVIPLLIQEGWRGERRRGGDFATVLQKITSAEFVGWRWHGRFQDLLPEARRKGERHLWPLRSVPASGPEIFG